MPWLLDLLSVFTKTEGEFISEATVKKKQVGEISEHFNMLAT